MNCNYRYCGKEIKYGRPDRRFCNINCKSKEKAIEKELKSLMRRAKLSRYFILRSIEKHNNRYNYDLVLYENCRTKVKIICPVHGEFEQTPDAHLYSGRGCEKCAREARRKDSNSE